MASKSVTLIKDGKTVHSKKAPVPKKEDPVPKEDADLDIEPEVEPPSSAAARKQKRAAPEKAGKPLGIVASAVAKASAESEKKKTPAKKAKKEPEAKTPVERKSRPAEDDSGDGGPNKEEDEDEPIPAVAPSKAAAEAPEKKEKKEVKVSNKGVPKGGRFDTVPLYKKNNKTGKAKTGEVSKRESRYLQTANGLLLKTTHIKRVAKHSAMTKALPVLEQEAKPQIARLQRRGKPVPANLTLCLNKKDRSISSGAAQLILAIAEMELARKFEVANGYRIHGNARETLYGRDLTAANQRLA